MSYFVFQNTCGFSLANRDELLSESKTGEKKSFFTHERNSFKKVLNGAV